MVDDDALMDRLSRPPSPVSGRQTPLGFLAGIAGTFGLGLVVYLSLSAGRHARAQSVPPPPRPVRIAQISAPPPAIMPAQAPPQVQQTQPDTPPPATSADELARLRAPSMVVDLSEPEPASLSAAGVPSPSAPGRPPGAGSAQRLNSDERFAERVNGSQVDTAHATRLTSTSLVAPQGTVISAVLETGINSDLPGFARAVVSRDVSGFDGSTVVIPRGSRLIGEYKSGVANGQSRAFVIWSRLLTPEGVSINLGSPGADRLGRGGLEGKADTHFFHRFGAAILLSVIDGAVQALANQSTGSGVNGIVISSPQQAANVATIALQKDIDIPTTITVAPGQAIRVFVARDLDFSDAIPTR
jgi:type IV secretion system protein VirB10